jgi:hypothetical protein
MQGARSPPNKRDRRIIKKKGKSLENRKSAESINKSGTGISLSCRNRKKMAVSLDGHDEPVFQ